MLISGLRKERLTELQENALTPDHPNKYPIIAAHRLGKASLVASGLCAYNHRTAGWAIRAQPEIGDTMWCDETATALAAIVKGLWLMDVRGIDVATITRSGQVHALPELSAVSIQTAAEAVNAGARLDIPYLGIVAPGGPTPEIAAVNLEAGTYTSYPLPRSSAT